MDFFAIIYTWFMNLVPLPQCRRLVILEDIDQLEVVDVAFGVVVVLVGLTVAGAMDTSTGGAVMVTRITLPSKNFC